jgi:hypothetical protein
MDEGLDKPKLRAARTTFLDNILQRSATTRVQSTQDEETTTRHPFYIHPDATAGMTPSIKRLKLFGSRSDDEEEASMSSSTRPKIPLLIRFYDPEIREEDAVGRTLDDILAWEDARLETCHNYIQMLFPLPEGSIFNMQAPIITREVMEAFRERDDLRGRLRESFQRILKFYGFKIKGEGEEDEAEDREIDEEAEEGEEEIEVEQSQSLEQVEDESEVGEPQNAASHPDGNTQTETANPTEVTTEPGTVASSEEPQIRAQDSVDPKKVVTGKEDDSDSKQKAQEIDNDQAKTGPAEQPADPDQITSIAEDAKPEPNGNLSTEAKASKAEPINTNIQGQPHYQSLIPPLGCEIVRGPNWRRAFRNWAIRFDHNHLRMTRILRSLRVLGLQDECDAFYDALKEVFNDERIYINERTMIFWRQAVRNPLYIAPDGEQVPWLKKWVKKHEG